MASGQAVSFRNVRFLNWQVHVQPSAPSKIYNFHTNASTLLSNLSFYDSWDDNAIAQPSQFRFPWSKATKIYSDEHDNNFRTPCLGSIAGDPQGEHCRMRVDFAGVVYEGQILGRAHAGFGVCNNSDCNTFVVQGASHKTSIEHIRFPFGGSELPT